MMLALVLGMSLAFSASDTAGGRDSVRSLNTPPWWQADVLASSEAFASRLTAWQWHGVAVRYRGKSASHALEAFTARRYDTWNSGFAIEESRTISHRAYVAVRAQLAPGATIVARSDVSATWYQGIGGGWELIPSARLMAFAGADVPMVGLGLGRYTGSWYLGGRVNRASHTRVPGVTWIANARRYASDGAPDFVDVVASHGNEPVVLGPSTVALRRTSAGAVRGQRMLTSSVGASLTITYDAHASLPDRRGVALATFIRW
jgi:YaiO family outer membrane protein